jgi:(p)ppGpp synthase/HD superfamily hydrolase
MDKPSRWMQRNHQKNWGTEVVHENYTKDRLFEQKALALATQAHGEVKQKNIYTGQDYIVHPIAVVQVLRIIHASSVVIAAAYLHDTLEDTKMTLLRLIHAMGAQVSNLVLEVSNVSTSSDGNRKARKQRDLQHFARASADGQNIKIADLIVNIGTLGHFDPKFLRVYLPEKIELFKALTKAHPRLRIMALELLNANSILVFGKTIDYDAVELMSQANSLEHEQPAQEAKFDERELMAA